ncbi:HAD family hydrolase [Scrofimicrobium sp. R131]|uniref:HAD family hydrolase n=1 Tax=Scrofimicrobium appendicitidis TaxID=3079930 RepID=A0AAU7V7Y2_9ACTO
MTSDWLITPPPSGQEGIPFAEAVARAEADLPAVLPDDPSQLLFALDIDGTMVGTHGVTDRMKQALAEAEAAGANIVIATGRGVYSTRHVVEELGLHRSWVVCSNGSLTVRWDGDGHQVADINEFDPRPTGEQFLETFPGILLGVDVGAGGMLVSQLFPAGELMRQELADSLEAVLGRRATRLVARAPWLERDDFAQQIDEMNLVDVEYAVGWTSWVDIGPAGVTKATGLQRLVDQLELPSTGTFAIGDGENDLAMLRWAHHGVAMGSADEAVRSAADAVTTAVEHDGAAAVIRAVLNRY